MSKEKVEQVKQEIESLNKKEINEIKEFVEHLSTGDSKDSSNEHSFEDKKLVKAEYSHKKAQEYLANNSESLDSATIKQIYEILNKVIYSTSSIEDNIVKAIDKVQTIELHTNDEKQVVVLGLLENFYNKCSMLCEEEEVEDLFIGALSYVHNNKDLQGFMEDIYADYFE